MNCTVKRSFCCREDDSRASKERKVPKQEEDDLEAQEVTLEWSTTSSPSFSSVVNENVHEETDDVLPRLCPLAQRGLSEASREEQPWPRRSSSNATQAKNNTRSTFTSWMPTAKVDWQESDADSENDEPQHLGASEASQMATGCDRGLAKHQCLNYVPLSEKTTLCRVRILDIVQGATTKQEPDVKLLKIYYSCGDDSRPWTSQVSLEHCVREEKLCVGLRTAAAVYPRELLEFFLERELSKSSSLSRKKQSAFNQRVVNAPSAAFFDKDETQRGVKPGFSELLPCSSLYDLPVQVDRGVQTPCVFRHGVTHNHYEGASFYLLVSDLDPDAQDLGNLIQSVARPISNVNPNCKT